RLLRDREHPLQTKAVLQGGPWLFAASNGFQEVVEAMHMSTNPTDRELRPREPPGAREALDARNSPPTSLATQRRPRYREVITFQVIGIHAVKTQGSLFTMNLKPQFVF